MSKKPTYEALVMRIQELEQAFAEPEKHVAPLPENEALLRILIRTLPDLVWLKDREGVYLFCNSRFEDFFGAKEKDIVGKTDYDFVEKGLADFFRKNDNIAMDRGRPTKNEEAVTFSSDGHREILETIKAPLYNSDGQVSGVLGIGRDITERKRAQAAVEQNRYQYESILSNLQGITYRCLLDSDWTMIYMSDHVDQLTGYPPGDFIHNSIRTFESIIHREDTAHVSQMVNAAIEKREAWGVEYRICHKDGSVRWVYEKGRTVVGADGKMEYLDGFIINITERKELEAQLRQAQKLESVGRLAGGVAHDFNNMLSIIIGHTEMFLEDSGPDHPFNQGLEEIRNAALRSTNFVRQLLAFARKQTIVPIVLDLNKTMEEMLDMLNRLIGEDIELAWSPSENLWPVKIDPSQIDQVLANFCVNSRDAIEGVGKVTITTENVTFDESYCRTHTEFSPGDYVMIVFSDNGCGMDAETIDNLFEPFFSTKAVGYGSGLGMATVYGIIKQNNGIIEVDSKVDEGSTFKVYLSRHTETWVKTGKKDSAGEVPSGREMILLVEDEEAMLKTTMMMLHRLGYTVLAASTPGEAIRIVEASDVGEVHLLMTDVVMPEMNGRDLAETLTTSNPNLKCLFMSGYTADVIAHRGVVDEGIQFINKPFSMRELAVKLREVIG